MHLFYEWFIRTQASVSAKRGMIHELLLCYYKMSVLNGVLLSATQSLCSTVT